MKALLELVSFVIVAYLGFLTVDWVRGSEQ